ETISPAQQRSIQELVSKLSIEDKAYAKRYGAIKTHFKVAKYNQLLASQFDEAIEILQGVVVEQKAIEQTKPQGVPENMTMINRTKIETALLAVDAAASRCNEIQEVERLFEVAEEAQKTAIKALYNYRRGAVNAINTAAFHARNISSKIN
ncbi:MAG: ORF6C domain-containing protein, partial [Mariprofundaceae bacterium]|nr:ORF6C domain-containing protein [Mariprofundaceae bacterium]